MFSFNWLFIIWRAGGAGGGGVRLKLDVQGQGGERILDVDRRGGVLKIGQFSWISYVYHPKPKQIGIASQRVQRSDKLREFWDLN